MSNSCQKGRSARLFDLNFVVADFRCEISWISDVVLRDFVGLRGFKAEIPANLRSVV